MLFCVYASDLFGIEYHNSERDGEQCISSIWHHHFLQCRKKHNIKWLPHSYLKYSRLLSVINWTQSCYLSSNRPVLTRSRTYDSNSPLDHMWSWNDQRRPSPLASTAPARSYRFIYIMMLYVVHCNWCAGIAKKLALAKWRSGAASMPAWPRTEAQPTVSRRTSSACAFEAMNTW